MNIYSKDRFEQVMNDIKTVVLPQIKTEIEARAKKTALAAAEQRIADIEAIIGSATTPDSDNVINKVVEFVAFFANITEDKTLAGVLASLKTEIEAEMESISYNSTTGKLQKTIGGQTTDIVSIVNSGFHLTNDETTGTDTFTAIGQATITVDNVNGTDEFSF